MKNTTLGTTERVGGANWNGDDAIASLNKVCEYLHKGEDGVSKLWSVVELNIEAILNKNCD